MLREMVVLLQSQQQFRVTETYLNLVSGVQNSSKQLRKFKHLHVKITLDVPLQQLIDQWCVVASKPLLVCVNDTCCETR